MKSIVFILLIVLTNLSFAQRKHWTNNEGDKVKKNEAISYYTLTKTETKTYLLKRHLKVNDSLYEEINYPTKEQLTKEGAYKRYFENGELAEQGHYLTDLKSGIWSHYHKNGTLKNTITYYLGVKEGAQTDYSQNNLKEAVYRYKVGVLTSIVELFDDAETIVFKEDTSEIAVYTFTDQEAEFPGGKKALTLFLEQNSNDSKENNTTIYLSFNVDSKGVVSEIIINELTNKNVSEEDLKRALKLVAKMPQWEPAMKRGRTVKSVHSIRLVVL